MARRRKRFSSQSPRSSGCAIAFIIFCGIMVISAFVGSLHKGQEISPVTQLSQTEPLPTADVRVESLPRQNEPLEEQRANSIPPPGFVPKVVTIKKAISFPAYEKGSKEPVGLNAAPIGTTVEVLKIQGTRMILEYKGGVQTAPVDSTDLLDRMLGTVSD